MNNVVLSTRNIDDLISDIANEVIRKINTVGQPSLDDHKADNSGILNISQAASLLSLKIPTIYSLISRGDLPVMKKNGRCYFSKAELMGYLKSGRKKTRQEISEEAEAYSVKRKRSRQ